MTLRVFRPDLSIGDEKLPENFLENYIHSKSQQQSAEFRLTENIENADFVLLPSLWNYYVDNIKIGLADEIIKQSQNHAKKIIIISSGDYTANGTFKDSIIIQSSCYKSRDGSCGNKHLAVPTFIDDYLQTYGQGEVLYRKINKKPLVGFCGQSNGTWLDYSRRKAHIIEMNLRYKLGMFKWEPPNIEPTLFRHRVLESIASCPDVQTNFIKRSKYRAGYRPKVKDPFHPTRVEFVNNIIGSDYTVCVRGGGNFSVRFYEILALGRIPIFINTDCILPLDELINYKEYMVWVERDELPHINQKILDFHNSLNPDKFTALQDACRKLWKTCLTKDGYCVQLANQLKILLTNAS